MVDNTNKINTQEKLQAIAFADIPFGKTVCRLLRNTKYEGVNSSELSYDAFLLAYQRAAINVDTYDRKVLEEHWPLSIVQNIAVRVDRDRHVCEVCKAVFCDN